MSKCPFTFHLYTYCISFEAFIKTLYDTAKTAALTKFLVTRWFTYKLHFELPERILFQQIVSKWIDELKQAETKVLQNTTDDGISKLNPKTKSNDSTLITELNICTIVKA